MKKTELEKIDGKEYKWIHTECGEDVYIDDSIKVSAVVCKKCFNQVILMPKGYFSGKVELLPLSKTI